MPKQGKRVSVKIVENSNQELGRNMENDACQTILQPTFDFKNIQVVYEHEEVQEMKSC